MKVTWEKEDIRAGYRFGKASIIERSMIGYDSTCKGPARWVWVSLSDGCVGQRMTQEEFAAHLTENEYVPEVLL